MNRILQVYLNADMRNGHDGLTKMAKKDKINVGSLDPGQIVVFVNGKKTKVKVYAANQVIAYLRLPAGQYVDLRTIQLIPKAFSAPGRLDYEAALREVLEKELAPRKTRHSVLELARAQ